MLQAALFGRNSDFSPDVDWDLVYQEARAQAIVPLLSSVLPDFVAPEKRKHWVLTASQLENRCTSQDPRPALETAVFI